MAPQFKESSARRTVRLNVSVPAHQPNIEYAVRHLFGDDANTKPRLVSQVDVDVTPDQYDELLMGIGSSRLRQLRNGPAAVVIDHVELQFEPAKACAPQEERPATLSIVEELTPGIWLIMTGFGKVFVREVTEQTRGTFLARYEIKPLKDAILGQH